MACVLGCGLGVAVAVAQHRAHFLLRPCLFEHSCRLCQIAVALFSRLSPARNFRIFCTDVVQPIPALN